MLVAGVADARSGKPLPDAEVVVFDAHRLAHTDWMGEARIANIPAGRHRVRVRKLGYASADLDLNITGDSVGPVFMLDPVATALDTVRVLADRVSPRVADYEIRRRQGIGRFLSLADLATVANRDFDVVAATRFPGLRIVTDDEGHRHLASTRSSCGGVSNEHGSQPPRLSQVRGGGGAAGSGAQNPTSTFDGSCNNAACLLRMFLDRLPLDDNDLDLVQTWDLAGVEYYTGASVPAEYRLPGSACGVLLLWSRW